MTGTKFARKPGAPTNLASKPPPTSHCRRDDGFRFDLTTAPTTTEELDDLLSEPDEQTLKTLRRVSGDFVILGAGGKMGPTFARLIRRASDAAGIPRRVIAVSRFSQDALRPRLESWGIETIACDLLDEAAVDRLPAAANVVSMLGHKFGTAATPSLTWAVNGYLPAVICRRYRGSRIAAFSSGNIYGMVEVSSGGSRETDPLRPAGEYANSVLGRERMYEHFSRTLGIPTVLLRLNYATELRYGVLVDLAQQVWRGTPIDVTMGYVNVIWQRDANAMALNALPLAASPPRVLNIAGAEILSVRQVAEQFGAQMGRRVEITGREASDAFLNQAAHNYPLLGRPSQSTAELIRWTAEWVMRGGRSHGKPTQFQQRGGSF